MIASELDFDLLPEARVVIEGGNSTPSLIRVLTILPVGQKAAWQQRQH